MLLVPAIALVGAFSNIGPEPDSRLLLVVVFTFFVLFASGLMMTPVALYLYFRFRFQLLADRVVVRTGILEVNDRVILYERLHGLDTSRSPLHRCFGTVKVNLQTSGGVEAEATLHAVPFSVVEELQNLIAVHQKQVSHPIVISEDEDDSEDSTTTNVNYLHSMSVFDCCKLAFIRSQTAVILSAIAAFFLVRLDQIRLIFGQFEPIVNPLNLVEVAVASGGIPWIEVSLIREASPINLAQSVLVFFAVFLLVFCVLSLLLTFTQYFRFRLSFANAIMSGQAGWLIHSRQNTPLHRIQTVKVLSTLRSRLLRQESIWFSTSAADILERDLITPLTKWLVPILPPAKTLGILRRTLPDVDFDSDDWEILDVATVWRRRFNLHLVYVLPLTLIFVLISPWLLFITVAMLIWAAIVTRLFALSLRFQVLDNAIMFRKGWWRREWTTVPFEKIHSVMIEQNPFDRRLKTAKLCVDTASHQIRVISNFSLRIPYMDASRAHEIRRLLVRESALRQFEW